MTAHRYWRLIFTNTDGGGVYAGSFCGMYTSAGAATSACISAGGTPSASSTFSGFSVSNMFANTGQWASSGAGNAWVQWDFGAGNAQSIVEVSWKARTDNSANQAPRAFRVQSSDDGSTWTTQFYGFLTGWTLSQSQRFTAPAAWTGGSTWAYWGLGLLSSVTGAAYSISEIENRATAGGSRQNTGGTATASENTGTAGNAYDGSSTTTWTAADNLVGVMIFYHFSSAVSNAQLAIQNVNTGSINGSPVTFDLIYGSDGIAFGVAASFTSATWTTNSQVQLFGLASSETSTSTFALSGVSFSAGAGDATGSSTFALGGVSFGGAATLKETASGGLALGAVAFIGGAGDATAGGALSLSGVAFSGAATRVETVVGGLALGPLAFSGGATRMETASGGLALSGVAFEAMEADITVAGTFALHGVSIAASCIDSIPTGAGRGSFWTFG